MTSDLVQRLRYAAPVSFPLGALCSEASDHIEAQDLRIAETRAAALEEAASLIERDIFDSSVRLDPSKHKNLSDWIRAQQAAAIRALIPEQKEG
ncbi:hypothetical protein ELG76_03950 [Rhizobium leguminosarum]|uniref:hypothetical protein n=1 Tax=Rhizobium leguminosarum TaxID=384 RepID=UPI00102FC343|nr:hypothetical protein [Rhizobium leguminosarum]TBG78574.1 hypothetical protein ELG76_03950 [Rhizobium leguminosarum]